jgi:flagellar basal-body rod protein FlgF
MIKGLYSAVSAMLVNQNKQQVLSHNASNMDTPGFKQVLATAEEYKTTTAIDPMSSLDSTVQARVLGTLGLGVQSGAEGIDFSQGSLTTTDNQTDLAIQGTAFFHVKNAQGDFYTRDGSFLVDASGNLTTAEGDFVLDSSGKQIQVGTGTFSVSSSGAIIKDSKQVAQLGLFEFTTPKTDLVHASGNLFTASKAGTAAKNSTVVQGSLESSNVDATKLMTSMIEISRFYEAAQQMVQNQDQLLGETISSLGKF